MLCPYRSGPDHEKAGLGPPFDLWLRPSRRHGAKPGAVTGWSWSDPAIRYWRQSFKSVGTQSTPLGAKYKVLAPHGAIIRMSDSEPANVPRTPEEPSADQLLDLMQPCEPYTVADLVDEFDASRWTIQRRLDTLVDDGEIQKKKHGKNRVSYWLRD